MTAVRIFKNRSPEWDGIAISDYPDINAVSYPYAISKAEAEKMAYGQSVMASLAQGDYLILVGADEKPYYSDNPGGIIFDVLFIPQ